VIVWAKFKIVHEPRWLLTGRDVNKGHLLIV